MLSTLIILLTFKALFDIIVAKETVAIATNIRGVYVKIYEDAKQHQQITSSL